MKKRRRDCAFFIDYATKKNGPAMENHDYKLKKIRGLTKEVEQLHPLLKDLLPKLPSVSKVDYTHGQNEMGADFIVTLRDQTLDAEEYVGLIVKSGDVRQDHDSLERQIKECSVPRHYDGGKKKINLNQIWVVSNGSVSGNAKEKIYEEYRARNIKFIWDERLVALVEKHYPEYWVDIEKNVAVYLSAVNRRAHDLNSKQSLLDLASGDFYVEQEVVRASTPSKKLSVRPRSPATKLSAVLKKERFVFVEAGMGHGKSRLLRQAAIEHAAYSKVAETSVIPVFINFRDLVGKYNALLEKIFEELVETDKIRLEKYQLLFLVDSLDEVKGDNQSKLDVIHSFVSQVMPHENIKVVFASRPFDDPLAKKDLERSVSRYILQPLSMQRLIHFVEKVSNKSSISSRLKADLQKSDLFRSLPKTPISAILLGRVLQAEEKELPSTLPELYSKYLDLALGRWDISKGKISEKEYETTVILVRLIARFMFENDIPEIGLGDIKDIVEEYLQRRETGQRLDQLFDNIIGCVEVFSVDEVRNTLFFKHRTFLEFMYSENMYIDFGKAAKIEHPFDGYWGAVNYFYLGKLKDCPDQLKKIFDLVPDSEPELVGKIFQAGSYLLAGYQSPYEQISACVRRTVLDAADLYCRVCEDPSTSPLGRLSEVQLLAALTSLMRHTFEYDFFERALLDVESDVLLSVDSDKRKAVAGFFIAAIRGGLGKNTAFDALVNDHLPNIPFTLRLCISHASGDVDAASDAIKRLEKKMTRVRNGNPSLIDAVYDIPLVERKGARFC